MSGMRNRRPPASQSNTDLVQKYIDSAYDNVKLVSDNIQAVLDVAEALDNGTFEDWITEAEAQALIDAAVTGLYEHRGTYDAASNLPDIDVDPAALTIQKADTWIVSDAGLFFTVQVEPGDLLIANQDSPLLESHWSIVQSNLDPADYATAAQGALADTAIQAADLGTAAYADLSTLATSGQGALATSALQPGDNISELVNDSGFTDDQTDAEIETAYNNQVDEVTQAEAEAGTDTNVHRWTPERVAQAIAALTPSPTESIIIAVSDEDTDLETGTAKITFRIPYGFDLDEVRASVNTAPTGAAITVDINEGGASILSTKLTIDATEKTSETAATAAVISDASLADDAEMTIDIDAVGSTIPGKGLKVVLIGTRT